ncbi:MAG: ATP-dependent RNA helicase HrpA [Kiritimatiellae bacterium]|nr:ATP-dependent RNA helicase HrpA [Kiritimatiellia bacterium]
MPHHIRYPSELPICARREEILAALRAHRVVVVCGDTGSGKTTQLPKMALELAPDAARRIACTQPRRLAAVAMAERVAEELQSPVGGLVGYQHRFARRVSQDTLVKFMTDGVLLAETRADPLLRQYGCIIVDEAHERSLNIDFLLGMLKRILKRRRDLKVIVSSATLDTERFSAFFDGAPVISVPGRLYPIEVRYRPPPEDEELDLPRDIASAISELPPRDDVLVFLPGERDIRETAEHLVHARRGEDDVIPLLASLPAGEQQRAFRPSPRRRIILATNVAETSVTIPGVRAVVDSGLARISRYVHRTQVQRLQIEPVSQASARQRAGRCGRIGPGTCIRLYSEEDFNSRDAYTPPEILRSSLAGVILSMLDLRLGDIERFPFIDSPKPAMVREGFRELLELGAVCHAPDGGPALTDTGRKLAQIPVEPRLARMLLAASENAVLPTAIPVVAALSCDDPRRRPIDAKQQADQQHAKFRVPGSDFLGMRRLWDWWEKETGGLSQAKARKLCTANFLSYPKMREWRDLARQLESLSRRIGLSFAEPEGRKDEETSAALHRSLLAGLLGRIGKFDEEARDYRGAHGLRFVAHPSSALKKMSPPWVFAGELVDTARLFARSAAALDPSWIEPVAGDLCKRHWHSPEWDPQAGFVRVTEQVTLYGLVIVPARRRDLTRLDPALARKIFIRRGLVDGEFPRPPAQVRENSALVDALRRRAEKERRPELFDAERLEAYFDKAVPPDVASADALRKWLARATPAQLGAFRLKKTDWWPAEEAASRDFPDAIRIGDVKMALSYRNAPGEEDDGVTCTVRASRASALRLWRADWLVPGLLPEKLTCILSGLPSSFRRVLSPIQDTVAGLLAHLKPGSEPLLDAVRRTVCEQWGFRIPPETLAAVRLPAHLRVRYRIVDDATGRVVAASRDLDEIFAALPQDRAPEKARSSATPSTAWTFGAIPEKAANGHAGWTLEHYPALQDEGTGVTLRLFANAEDAASAHAAGVARLFLLALGPRARTPFRRGKLPFAAAAYLRGLDYSDDRMADDILSGAVREAFVRGLPPVRDGDEFARRLEERRTALNIAQDEIGRIAAEAADAAAKVAAAVESPSSRFPRETADSVQTQLAWLLFRGFPRVVPLARLRHYARYLKGAAIRLDRARVNPSGDLAKEKLLAPHWLRYATAVADKSGRYDAAALSEYRWMVEEYRVSLFAQELHTPAPVSPKRLDALWLKADRN